MSEEIKRMNAFDAFRQTQQTFQEAEEKAKQEAGAPKVERFRIGEDGEFNLRVLPIAPDFDDEGNILPMKRKGYEYPLHQMFLKLHIPGKKGKSKTINIPVLRTTDKEIGYSVDLIDTYTKIARELYADDEELLELVNSSGFSGGLRWNYQHAMLVLDVSSEKERAKGPQLFECSHSQYKEIDAAKMRLWRELREDGGQDGCPISGFTDAYPIKVIRTNTNGKTEYTIEIGRKVLDIRENEAEKLLDLPRIPELVYRYTRYQYEATLEFLKQYDAEHDMEVCKEADFIEAAEKLKGELSPDDTSHFDFAKSGSKGSDKDVVTVESLWQEYDVIVDQDLDSKSPEYLELREKIRQYIEDNNLDVRLSKSKNNQMLLEEVEQAVENGEKLSPDPQPESKAVERTACVEEEKDDEDEVEKPAPRQRRPRPGSEPVENQIEEVADNDDDDEKPAVAEPQEEERPRRRRLR